MNNEIVLTKHEEDKFRTWLINKGYKNNITMKQMVSEYHMFMAYNTLFT